MKENKTQKNALQIEKRELLRQYALTEEIAACVDCVADEIHSCFNIESISEPDEIKSLVTKFPMEWQTIRKYLIDGCVSFELIHDNKSPLGIKEIDPTTIISQIRNGKTRWIQYPENPDLKRVLFDSQIVNIVYSEYSSHQSYVETLVRPFNHMKLIQDCYIAGKITVPGIKTHAALKDVEYFTSKFELASRIPESFKRSENVFNFEFDSVDKRWEKFIKKHALNLYSIYVKMANVESVELKKLYTF